MSTSRFPSRRSWSRLPGKHEPRSIGWLAVASADRDGYVAGCVTVVDAARAVSGCLDFSITADTVDPDRICIFERWQSEQQLMAFRGSGPSDDQQATILDADVKRYEVVSVGDP